MKWSNLILATTLVLLAASIFLSNALLKSVYDKVDKSDPYWSYVKALDQDFHHLNIRGGNITNIDLQSFIKVYQHNSSICCFFPI